MISQMQLVKPIIFSLYQSYHRAVGRSENSGVPVLFGRHNLPSPVGIGLTDLPNIGGALAPPVPASLKYIVTMFKIT